MKILRWLFLLPGCVISYVVVYNLSSILLKLTTGFFLPYNLHVLLAWPSAGLACGTLVYVALLIAPSKKPQIAFLIYVLQVLLYGGYIFLLLSGQTGGRSPIEGIFELVGGAFGGGATLYYLHQESARKGYAKIEETHEGLQGISFED